LNESADMQVAPEAVYKRAMTQAGNAAACDLMLVIADLGLGGAQRVAVDLANAWTRENRRICVVTFGDESSDLFKLDARIVRIVVDARRASRSLVAGVWANLRRIRLLRRAIRRSRCARVLSFVGSTNVLTVLATAGMKVTTVISERNDPSRQSLGHLWNGLRRLTYRHADVVTANSRTAISALRTFVPEARLAFVPNPVRMPPAFEAKRGPLVLAVGRFVHQKAWDVLIEAFARAASAMPRWNLAFVGAGELEPELRRLARERGIAARVQWIGVVDDAVPYYASASVFALPSRYEGTPNALLEAMASGLVPVVSDAASDAGAYVRHGETGLVVPVEDAPALAQALVTLANDWDLRRRLGDAARSSVARLSPEAILRHWELILGLGRPASDPLAISHGRTGD
jgi:glycosyltransferase involved in cell wall biosynthesis